MLVTEVLVGNIRGRKQTVSSLNTRTRIIWKNWDFKVGCHTLPAATRHPFSTVGF
jgi:hypothetical protein